MSRRKSKELFLRKHGVLAPLAPAEQDLINELYHNPDERAKMSREQQAHWAASKRAEHIKARAGMRSMEVEVALLATSFAAKMIRASRSSHGSEIVAQQSGNSPKPVARLDLKTYQQVRQEQRQREEQLQRRQSWSQKRKAHVLTRFQGVQRASPQIHAGVAAVVFVARLRSRSRHSRMDEMGKDPADKRGSDGLSLSAGSTSPDGYMSSDEAPATQIHPRAKSWRQRCVGRRLHGLRTLMTKWHGAPSIRDTPCRTTLPSMSRHR